MIQYANIQDYYSFTENQLYNELKAVSKGGEIMNGFQDKLKQDLLDTFEKLKSDKDLSNYPILHLYTIHQIECLFEYTYDILTEEQRKQVAEVIATQYLLFNVERRYT